MNIIIPIYEGFTALDAIGPYEVLSALPGARVTFAATKAGPIPTHTGVLSIVATRSLDEIKQADIVVVPGGPGVDAQLADRPLIEWLRAIHPTTTWTTSVCTGSLILAAAGVLEGLEATTHWSVLDRLAEFGARPSKARVVEQGKIITAAGVSSGIDMALTLAAKIAGERVAKAIQLVIEYDPQPPFDAGSVDKAGPEIVGVVQTMLAAGRAAQSS